ncbi:hypothetical protein [Frigoriglobus tundricola]|uniref:Uncharacterized protein n=1 Tax=Frigoriglobus tundricola TaxID=2774151 RepID=A0A6M5YMZ5_9BACT|nr:hypothetical protein [Frigoriglobus tundricola]QJW94716.1 hypothetical protein FTUN_2238 [Frigoriglobus tundricola]
MCGWYEIDPTTGALVRWVEKGETPAADKYYLEDGWSVREHVWELHDMLSERGRPPIEDIVAFVVDDHIPESFAKLDAAVVDKTYYELADLWKTMGEEYREALGRDPYRVERYWMAFPEVRKMATGREQFYAGKAVRREEWFLYDWDLIFHDKQTWARLRVFDDGSADAWTATGLAGFDDEGSAGTFIGEEHYASLDTLRGMPDCAPKVPPGPPTDKSDQAEPFRYFGRW